MHYNNIDIVKILSKNTPTRPKIYVTTVFVCARPIKYIITHNYTILLNKL